MRWLLVPRLVVAVLAMAAVALPVLEITTASAGEIGRADRRAELRAHLGGPDAFVITAGEHEGELVRFESWIYYEALTQFDFADSEILWSVELDPVPDGSLYPLQYDPGTFELLASTDDVRALLPDVELTQVKIGDKAIPKGVFLAGEQLLLGFVDDQLIYAESMALVPEGT